MAESVDDLIQLDNFQNIFRLDGKVAVISGGSRGLGLQAASGFLQAGCSKVYVIARTAADVEAASDGLNALSFEKKLPDARAIPIVGDISKAAGCEQIAREIGETTDHIDIFLANAGATHIGPFDDTSEDDFARVMEINVNSVFFSIQKLTPLLSAKSTVSDPSRVIMVSSVAGVVNGDVGSAGTYAYAASKAAVIHLMHNLAVELGPRHITVNAVAPGIFPSKMSGPLMDRHGGIDEIAKQIPDQKLGTKEDIAGMMVFFGKQS